MPGGPLIDPLGYPWTDGVALTAPGPRTGRAVVAVGCNAAPYAAPGRRTDVHVSWLDDGQLAALDETEPNYERISVGEVDLYVSKWGVLGLGGLPTAFTTQRELHQRLQRHGAGYDIVDAADARGTLGRLLQPDVRDRLREQWAVDGFAVSSGLAQAPRFRRLCIWQCRSGWRWGPFQRHCRMQSAR